MSRGAGVPGRGEQHRRHAWTRGGAGPSAGGISFGGGRWKVSVSPATVHCTLMRPRGGSGTSCRSCPVSTGGGTRRVQLVREGRGGCGRAGEAEPPAPSARSEHGASGQGGWRGAQSGQVVPLPRTGRLARRVKSSYEWQQARRGLRRSWTSARRAGAAAARDWLHGPASGRGRGGLACTKLHT